MRQVSRILASTLFVSALASGATHAQSDESLFGIRSASVTYGPYARLELGAALPLVDNGYWESPGRSDPRITFDVDANETGFGALAFGFDWQNGYRADLAVFGTGTVDVSADCASASDGSSCSTHGDISDAPVSTRGVMASLFFSPLEARGSNSPFQPFVVAGLGMARNEMGDWTRVNPSSGRPERTFEGASSSGLAWSLGVGAALQVTQPGRWPVIVEASWRYYDFGQAEGGSTPLPGNGASEPRQPFNFDHTDQVVTLGVRIPLQRY